MCNDTESDNMKYADSAVFLWHNDVWNWRISVDKNPIAYLCSCSYDFTHNWAVSRDKLLHNIKQELS